MNKIPSDSMLILSIFTLSKDFTMGKTWNPYEILNGVLKYKITKSVNFLAKHVSKATLSFQSQLVFASSTQGLRPSLVIIFVLSTSLMQTKIITNTIQTV